VTVGGSYISPYEYYIIKRTTNGGNTWTTVGSGTQIILEAVCFADESIGFTVGHHVNIPGSGIRKTTNGGLNWSSIGSGFNISTLYDIFSPDANNVTAIGASAYGGIIFNSTDGGANWSADLKGTTAVLYGTSFANTNNGFAVGEGGVILTTADSNVTFISETHDNKVPAEFLLSQNYPNPFNPVTKIKFEIPAPLNPSQGGTLVHLVVYDILGREVATLVNEEKPNGEYEVEFDGADLPSGIYFYQLRAGQYSETKKMILLK
ncbi:MAG: T9SS type A sorting domain-containing protein, partial [Ignavibacteriaceae bacterium]